MTATLDKPASAAAQIRTSTSTLFTIRGERTTRKGPMVLDAVTGNEALAAALEALIAAVVAEQPVRRAHTAAEEALAALGRQEPKPSAAALAVARRSEREADQLWTKAYEAVQCAASAVLAVEAATPADIQIQLRAYAWAYEAIDCLDILDEEDAGACLAAVQRGLARVAASDQPPAPPSGALQAWEQAVAGYEAIRDRKKAFADECTRTRLQALKSVPPQFLVPSEHYGLHRRWTPEDLERDILLSDRQKAELRPGVAEADAAVSAAEDGSTDDEFGRLDGLETEAENALMRTPAPTPAALAYKSALKARNEDDNRFGCDDLGHVAFLLSHFYCDRDAILTHMDILRVAGIDHPMLHMAPFDPGEWVTMFEGLGGVVSLQDNALLLIHTKSFASRARLMAIKLLAELNETPWKYRAIHEFADYRRGEGGDPIFDNVGRHGDKDRRGTRPDLSKVFPIEAVTSVRFAPGGAQPLPVVTQLVRQGDELVPVAEGKPMEIAA